MKANTELALELFTTIQDRKRIEKREKELKTLFRNQLDQLGVNAVQLGNLSISLTEKTRRDLDKKSLTTVFGKAAIDRVSKKITYTQLNIEKVSVEIKEAA